ncbi:MAG: hypothetical protein GF315_01125 [candidate division Zixibacteria bacterium]|nr:hypothetical protein [candidate division Zixibacteria bacterium]
MIKYKLGIYCLAILLLIASSAFSQNVEELEYPKLNKLEIPDVEKVSLSNGLRIYILEDHSLPLFNARLRINCGSYLEPADKSGLADICGVVMRTGGTSKYTGDEIDEILEGVGGSVETSIGRTSGSASVNVLSEYSELGIEVLAEILRRPVFDEDKIELAQVEQRSAISRRNDDPFGIARREYRKIIYGEESVYARHAEYATINAISRDDLVDFHGQYLYPENIQIAVWGDFEKKDIINLIKKYFGDWKRGDTRVPPLPPVEYDFVNRIHYIEKEDVNQSNILMGHIGGLRSDDDYADRIVMNSVLGGSFGSRLFNNVRSKEGLAYAAYGVYTANVEYPGIFYNYVATKSETTGKAINEVIEEIERMQTDPPTEEEMEVAKGGYLNSFVFNFDSKAEVIQRLMTYDFYGLPHDLLQREKERVERVSPQDVVDAAKANLHPEQMHILIVGKGDNFDISPAELNYGPVDTIDISIPSGEATAAIDISPEKVIKGKALLAEAVEAVGGEDALNKVESIRMKGTFKLITPQGEIPVPYERLYELPDRYSLKFNMMGQNVYDIFNRDKGWNTGPTGQVVEKTEEDIKQAREEIDRELLYILKQANNPDYTPVYDGERVIEGAKVEYVAIADKDGERICRLGFGSKTHLPVSNSYWGETPMGEGNVTDTYESYDEINGVKIAVAGATMLDGNKIAELQVSEVEINPAIPENAFSKPE